MPREVVERSGTGSEDRAEPVNRWTGGQYSLYRVCLAAALLFLVWSPMPVVVDPDIIPWSGQLELHDRHRVPLTLISFGIAVGLFDRWLALVALVAAFCFGRGLTWFLVQPLLLAHALTPPAPYGSWTAAGRPDPGGGWRRSNGNLALATLPALVVIAAMLLFPLHDVLDETEAGVAIFSVALVMTALVAWSSVLQRFAWFIGCMFLGLVIWATLAKPPANEPYWLGLGVASIAAFDPRLLSPRRGQHPETVYYDGDCGLCHRTVRFLLAEDADAHFRFAALQSDHFAEHVSETERAALADSVIVRAEDGRLLQRSSAVVHLLLALGGLWRVIGSLVWCIPGPLRDLGYDVIAKLRKRVFPAPKGLCPLIPPELGVRFLG